MSALVDIYSKGEFQVVVYFAFFSLYVDHRW